MTTVTVVNRTAGRVPAANIRRMVRRAAALLRGRGRFRSGPAAITIVFITAAESRRLKRRFLKKDRAANVLSFRYDSEGELFLAPAVIRTEAGNMKKSYTRLLAELAIHGVLHLYGYHHERSRSSARRFEARERRISRAIGLV